MNAHFRMITLGVHVCCPSLLIFQKWIATSFKKQKNYLHRALFCRLHKRGFVADSFLIYDLSKHRRAMAFLNDEIYSCDIAGPCSMM